MRAAERRHGARRCGWTKRAWSRIGLITLLSLAVFPGSHDFLWAQERELGYAIDISHHTGEITKEDVHCWLASGVKHIIVRAAISEELNDNRGRSRRQLLTLWRAMYEDGLNFSVDLYLYVHWTPNDDLNFYLPVPEQVGEAIALAQEFAEPNRSPPLPIGRLWIDLEEDPLAGQTQQDIVDGIEEALEACNGFPCGIYTRLGWWQLETGNAGFDKGETDGKTGYCKYRTSNPTEFCRYPLWYAQYSCPVEESFDDFSDAFGGWAEPYGKQYDEHKEIGSCEANPRICNDTVHDSNTMYLPPKSDLVVTGLDFTSPPVPGKPTTVMATLSNAGELSHREFIHRVFTVRWFHDSPAGLETVFNDHPPVAPGESANAFFSWTPIRGTHNFAFLADVDGEVPETDESNNSAAIAVTVLDVDLEASGIHFSSPPTVGVETTAIPDLANLGLDESGEFRVRWLLDGVEVASQFHEPLEGGEVSSDDVEFLWTPTPGAHTLAFEADIDNRIPELDETNNTAEVTVTPREVNLQVSGIRFASTPSAGERTTVIAQLANVGLADSGPFNVKWFLDGVEVGYGRHDPLAAGEISSDNVKFFWTPTPGTHTFLFAADVGGVIRESDETDNVGQVTVSVPDRWPWSRSLIEYRFDSESDFNDGVVPNRGLLPFLYRGRILGKARQVTGVLGKAIELDGETTYVEVQNSGRLSFRNGVTVQAWVLRESNENEDAIASKWYGGQDQWLLTFYPNGNGLLIFTVVLRNGTYTSVEYPIPTTQYLGQWVEVGARFDRKDGLRLYWNGQQVAYRPVAGQRMASGRNPIHIGDAGQGTTWSRFNGQIDQIHIDRSGKRDSIELSYSYSFGDRSGTTNVLLGDTFTIWDQPGGCGAAFPDVAQCQTNDAGEVRAYNHDCLSEDGPGTYGDWARRGCSTAAEFGYVVECCVER